jgi:hypothetical protein
VGGRGIEGRCWAGVWYAVAMQGNECSIGEDSLCNYVFLVLEKFLTYFGSLKGRDRIRNMRLLDQRLINNDVVSKGSRYDTCRWPGYQDSASDNSPRGSGCFSTGG